MIPHLSSEDFSVTIERENFASVMGGLRGSHYFINLSLFTSYYCNVMNKNYKTSTKLYSFINPRILQNR